MSELHLSLRRLASRPGQTLLAVLAVALGIGFTVAMLSILRGSVLKDLPFRDPYRLMFAGRLPGSGSQAGVGPAELRVWSEKQRSFSELVGWLAAEAVLTGDGRAAEGARAAYVTQPFFSALGVQSMLGRSFLPMDDWPSSSAVVILGYDLWSRRYQKDPEILGKTVRIGGGLATIVGVMPRDFRFPIDQELWLPLGPVLPFFEQDGTRLSCFGRLRAGVTPDAARSELTALSREAGLIGEAGPEPRVLPFIQAYTDSARRPLGFMMAAVVGVLLIACTNVAGLLFAQNAGRESELAVRFAVGAQRRQIFRLVLLEALCIAALGALAGLGIAAACIELYERTGGLVHAFWVDVRLEKEAVLFAAAAALAATLLAGILPALKAARTDTRTLLQERSADSTGSRLGRWGRALVTFQIALSCALLVGTGQMIGSVRNLYDLDFGAAPDKLWTALLVVDTTEAPGPADWLGFFDATKSALASVAGVGKVAFTSNLPAGRTPRSTVEIEGRPAAPESTARWSIISPGYFDALGRPILQGRDFQLSDTAKTSSVVLVNRSFAKRFFSGSNPVGRRLRLEDPRLPGDWATVIGVVPDLYVSWDYFSDRLDALHPEGVYFPVTQLPRAGLYVLARADGDVESLAPALRKTFAHLHPNVPLLQAQPLSEFIRQVLFQYHGARAMFTVFGLAALILTAVGLYGTVSFTASQRGREMALRLAVGASPWRLMGEVMRKGFLPVVWGAAAGFILALALSRLLGSLLFGVRPGEPLAFGGTAAVLFIVAFLACLSPALRVARAAPARVLRSE